MRVLISSNAACTKPFTFSCFIERANISLSSELSNTKSPLSINSLIWPSLFALFSIAVLLGAAAPVIVGAAADSMGLGETQLGLLIGLYFAGFGIVSATSYLWIRKVNWRVYSSIGVIMMGFSWILAGMIEGYPTLLFLMFVVGIGAGLFASPSITILGDGTEAENGFSWMIIFSVAGAAALLALFPIVAEISGFRGVTNLLGGSTLATLLLIPLIPVNNEKEETVSYTHLTLPTSDQV